VAVARLVPATSEETGAPSISLSDYTLGFGQGWCVDKVLREHPEVIAWYCASNEDGRVRPETVPQSLNPMHPMSGKWYAEKFFGQFERHYPGEGGRSLNYFFSDELSFGVDGNLWSANFAAEFQKRKGYDLVPNCRRCSGTSACARQNPLDYRDVMCP